MKIITTENIEEARKLIEKTSKEGKQVIVQGSSIDFNRILLENKRVNMLILLHTNKKDRLKQRDSGLNHVLCNIAKTNNITLAIDFTEIENEKNKKSRALILGRIRQNIKLMKKAKCKLKIINFNQENKREIFSLLLTLGADTKLAEEAVS